MFSFYIVRFELMYSKELFADLFAPNSTALYYVYLYLSSFLLHIQILLWISYFSVIISVIVLHWRLFYLFALWGWLFLLFSIFLFLRSYGQFALVYRRQLDRGKKRLILQGELWRKFKWLNPVGFVLRGGKKIVQCLLFTYPLLHTFNNLVWSFCPV